MPSLEMSLGLRIRSKVNSVQNNIEKNNYFLCHLLTMRYPLNSLKLSRMYLKYMLHLMHNLDIL